MKGIITMKTITTSVKLTPEEREVTINIAPDGEGNLIAFVDTSIQKYATRCKKMGWTQISETRHADGNWVAAEFTAPAKALSFRNPSVKRVMSEEQRQIASERMKRIAQSRTSSGNNIENDEDNETEDDD